MTPQDVVGDRPAGGFDRYAHQYDALLEDSLRITGEDKLYFARGRVAWLRRRLERLAFSPDTVLDFGCGSGAAIPLFFEMLGTRHVIALEESGEFLDLARREHGERSVTFSLQSTFAPREICDLVYCSAVFHHIPPEARLEAARAIRGYLRPGGLLALWEHNAWSPAARYVMSRCEFDRGVRPWSVRGARRLLAKAGFGIVATDFLFIYPRLLGWLRWSEPWLARFPIGAQYLVLARRVG